MHHSQVFQYSILNGLRLEVTAIVLCSFIARTDVTARLNNATLQNDEPSDVLPR